MDISRIIKWFWDAVDWVSGCWSTIRPFLKKALSLCWELLLLIVTAVVAVYLWAVDRAKRLGVQLAAWLRKARALSDQQVHRKRERRWIRYGAMALLACFMCFCLFQLGVYVRDYFASRRTSAQLRDAYYDAMAAEKNAPAAPTPALTPAPESTPDVRTAAPTTAPSPAPTATPKTRLDAVKYPGNPNAATSSRFKTIQRQNSDIIGWLSIPGAIDEAVVQRDNTYYLRRDYRGYHNDNGAIFLEESCKLNTRPYTLMLFGHNMKSGAMFGCLRNYENVYYYRNNAFVTFDTAYEDGQYVIFAAGTLSQDPADRHFVDTVKLCSLNIRWREEAIRQLRKDSEISTGIGVAADDQLLLLVTCVGDATERRFVAARRIRAGETADELLRLVKKAQ